MSNDEINAIIADYVGDDGFFPSENCQHGHANIASSSGYGIPEKIGGVCFYCATERRRFVSSEMEEGEARITLRIEAEDKNKPSDFLIQRGKPKNYCGSLALLLPVVESWCEEHGYNIDLLSSTNIANNGRWRAIIYKSPPDWWPRAQATGHTAPEALAMSFALIIIRLLGNP